MVLEEVLNSEVTVAPSLEADGEPEVVKVAESVDDMVLFLAEGVVVGEFGGDEETVAVGDEGSVMV